jgi:hypothetical protein
VSALRHRLRCSVSSQIQAENALDTSDHFHSLLLPLNKSKDVVKEIACVVASSQSTCVYRCLLTQSLFTALTTDYHTMRPNHVHCTCSLSSSVINNQVCRGPYHHLLQNPSHGCVNSLRGLVNPDYHIRSDSHRPDRGPSDPIISLPSRSNTFMASSPRPESPQQLLSYRPLNSTEFKINNHRWIHLEINMNRIS